MSGQSNFSLSLPERAGVRVTWNKMVVAALQRAIAVALIGTIITLPTLARAEVLDPLAQGPDYAGLFPNAPLPQPINPTSTSRATVPAASVQRVDFEINAPAGQSSSPAAPAAPSMNSPGELPAPAGAPVAPAGPVAAMQDPCGAVSNKPLSALGISIAQPAGKLPTDLAAPCWNQINQTAANPNCRCWSCFDYNWDATCLAIQPLYFEEVNLERYGYQCGDRCCCCSCGRECCLQPAVSACHFFATIPMLPYCMGVECPGNCVYTLGYYRPGDCNPKRYQWPLCDCWAATLEAGAITGLVFILP